MKAYILGSGIGGMSCAAFLANNGFDVTVLEQNSNMTILMKIPHASIVIDLLCMRALASHSLTFKPQKFL